MAASYRLACVVPFCLRTKAFDQPGGEWICADHWRLTDRRLRHAMFRRRRMLRRGLTEPHRSRFMQRGAAIWERLKRQAIERAMGVRG